ncbi:MAG: dipeptidase [Anaerotignum sp.]|nr:dipeptidase [Anaerotignum sp.]
MKSFIDAHCDTIVKLANRGGELAQAEDMHLDLKRLKAFPGSLQFFAIWLDPQYYAMPMRRTMKYIDFYHTQMEKNKDTIRHILTFADILENKRNQRLSSLLSLEGGEALEGEISALHIYYRLGVRAMTLTWNHRNALADGAAENATGGGLTKFGKEVVSEMEALGMVVDVSHLADAGFWDVEKLAKKPFISSHSNARAICPSQRNLTDDQLRALAAKGGVVGLNFYPAFLREGDAGIDDVLRHTDHMLKIMGEDYIGFGSDWDGIDTTPKNLSHVGDMSRLLEKMEQEFGGDVMEKIREGNFLRVLQECL